MPAFGSEKIDRVEAGRFRRDMSTAFLVCLAIAVGALLAGIFAGGILSWLVFFLFAGGAIFFLRPFLVVAGLAPPRPGEAGRPIHRVTFDQDTIFFRDSTEQVQHIGWDTLRQVGLLAVDAFPAGDVYWMLTIETGHRFLVSIEADGADVLMEELARRLPGFNSEKVVEGMLSLQGYFLVWDHESGLSA